MYFLIIQPSLVRASSFYSIHNFLRHIERLINVFLNGLLICPQQKFIFAQGLLSKCPPLISLKLWG